MRLWRKVTESGRCSAIVKFVPGAPTADASAAAGELFVAHNTWTDYYEMVRVVKTFDFKHVRNAAMRNRRVHFYSYPGTLFAGRISGEFEAQSATESGSVGESSL